MADQRKTSPVVLVLSVLFAIVVVLGGRWYWYVAHAESPYDEIGITLNANLPGPLRAFGCRALDERFPGNAAPPMGCERGSY